MTSFNKESFSPCLSNNFTKKVLIEKFDNNTILSKDDFVIKEDKIDFYLNGQKLISIMSLTKQQDAHIIGFLLSEAVIKFIDDIKSIVISEDGLSVYVEANICNNSLENLFKQKTLTSGCCVGVTGNAENLYDCSFITTDYFVNADDILKSMREFNKATKLFEDTGCVHKAQIVLEDGSTFIAEDIGRHNAVDKVIGLAFLNRKDFKKSILYASGRLSNEMVVKCVMHKIPIIVSKAAVTFAGIKAANEHGVTLIGFARNNCMNIYTHTGRIKVD